MLRLLRVRDLALLEEVEVEFEPGLNVLTGETGAGKSLLVQAVTLLRGERADAHTVRAGADDAAVEALFSDDTLLRRVIGASGRGRAYVGSALSTVGEVAAAAAARVDVAGQHEHQTLCDARRHRDILDAFGVDVKIGARMAAAWEALDQATRALDHARERERGRAEREDFLGFQVREIDAAALAEGDDQRLPAERERLRHAARLSQAARGGEEALYAGDDAVATRIARVEREIAAAARIDPGLAAAGERLGEARATVEDVARDLGRYAGGLADDPAALERLDERLETLRRLQRKHGATAAEILARREALAADLAALEGATERREELEARVAGLGGEARAAAAALSRARRAAAADLGAEVGKQLARLGMAGARFEVAVETDEARLSAAGADAVELRIAPNPGEGLRPLARVASGGELSRVMLAIRRVLAEADPVPTYVFDEVDAGVSGAVAETIGRLLRDVARRRQVLVTTHLAPVAAYAGAHFVVEKKTRGGRTATRVRRLADGERREELARMLAGAAVTDRARAHADEMLRAARGAGSPQE